MDITVSRHAKKRMKERLGLPKSAIIKTAETAYREGRQHNDFSGSVKRYLDGLYLRERTVNNLRVYGKYVYLFAGATLVTVHEFPPALKRKV